MTSWIQKLQQKNADVFGGEICAISNTMLKTLWKQRTRSNRETSEQMEGGVYKIYSSYFWPATTLWITPLSDIFLVENKEYAF